jgi:nucleoside-diphosphate-sugar epimerase
MILGAGGKMGPTLALLAKKAVKAAGLSKRIIAVSRFTDPIAVKLMNENQIETISADLLEPGILNTLPDVENIIYMAGRKFGTNGQEAQTWAMNAWLPALVSERYKKSKIVVFSSGNIYPMVSVSSGGASEQTPPEPVGEYAMSCLARERMFEFGSQTYGTPVFLYRLNYAVDLRYGVLYDIAAQLLEGKPIKLSTPCFNCIWQGDANEMALRALLHTGNPAVKMNITGPETISIRYAAEKLGMLLSKTPVFEGDEAEIAYLSNSSLAMKTFGTPAVSVAELIEWQAEWISDGGRSIAKPTHFEERKGKY